MQRRSSVASYNKAEQPTGANTQAKPQQEVAQKKSNAHTQYRQNGITIISGAQGVGKSHNIKKIIKDYVRDNEHTGKKGGKVLIYDVNDEYTDYMPIAWKDIKLQKPQTVRRVLPFRKVGNKVEPFGTDELKDGFLVLLEEYKDGLLILEDFNTYALNTRSQKVLSTITRARHKQIDILIVLQEIGKITKDLWSNISFYIYHKQTSEIDKERDKINNFIMVKIGDNIVNEQFNMAQLYFDEKKITYDDYVRYKAFFVSINFKTNKITGCSQEAFQRGLYRFLKVTDKERMVKEYCLEHDLKFTNSEHKKQAYSALMKRYALFYGGK